MAHREMVSYGDLEMAEPPPFVEPPERQFSESSAGETVSDGLNGLDSQMTTKRNRGNLWMDSAERRMQNNPVADERNGGFKLFVTGLGPTTDVDALKSLFGEYGTVTDAFVKDGNNGKFAFVSLSTIEEGEKASAALGHREIDGSHLRVSWAKLPRSSLPESAGRGPSGSSGDNSSGPAGFSLGNKLMGEPCPDERNGGFKLMVVGLASTADSEQLRELFGKSGAVKDVFVKENDRGKFAFVTMESVEQCQAVAAELGGKNINGSRFKFNWARPRTGGAGGSGTPGGSNCFKCGQPGHRAAACPGSSAASATTSFSASSADASGWNAAPNTTSAETTGSTEWMNSAPISSEATCNTSGWADKPAEASGPTASGGGWGENSGSTSGGWGGSNPTSSTESSGGWGSGGTGGGSSSFGSSSTAASSGGRNVGLTGDPCPDERHGGFKLNLMGIANSVDGERLKELFGKSGTVKDVFIKDGEKGRFGFVTMETVEQCQAAAASLGGMTIDGSPFKISWARARPGNQNSSGPKPASATCFKCGQSGHRSFECPGSKANTTQVTSADTSPTAWDSAPAASNENSAGGGWANASASGQGGWGDSGSTPAAADTGGGSSSFGSSSTPASIAGRNAGLTGDPCPDERNGGFKLMVVGLASTADSEQLRELFGKSGAVKDVFVKENDRGKFAFVTMESVEQCQAVAAELGGKNINGSRFKFNWARPRTGGAGGSGTPGGSNCFKCGQPGHRAAACPGSSAASATTSFSASSADASGWNAAPNTTSAETTGSTEWMNSAPISSEATCNTSGWADKPAEASGPTASGGGWGENSGSTSGGWGGSNPTSSTESSGGWGSGDTGGGSSSFGSSNTPASIAGRNAGLTGDPCPDERSGGFKLMVVGLASTADSEQLRELFGKSGTVRDVFVKENDRGKFAFVTMESVDQCQAVAADLGGKDINGSRFKFNWARPRTGGAGGGGTPGWVSGASSNGNQRGLTGEPCPDDRNGGFKLMIGNLATSFDSDRLKDLFGKSGCVKDAFVKENDRGKFAFVTMETVEQCEAVAVEFGGKDIDGSRLRISWAKPRTGGGGNGGTPGGSSCFKCQQPGHRAAACPGLSGTSITTSFSTSASGASGWDATPITITTETTESSGWTNSVPASSEAPNTTSGWADKPAEASNSTASGGGWGENSSSTSGGWGSNTTSITNSSGGGWGSGDTGGGSSNTPSTGRSTSLTGDPCPDERHGGFKLNLVGIANSVDSERLKELFGKSGTVKDVFIKDGEKGRFGFVTMETVEQCEAAAASLGGMTIDGSRFRISWARARPGNQNSSGPKPAGAGCFKCGQSGHRSFECPGSKANTTQVTSSDTSSSGWGSAPAASTENSAGGGWGDGDKTASVEAAPGGWGSATTSVTDVSGSGWGSTDSTGQNADPSASGGQSNFSNGNQRGLTGDPCPDDRNGGFKLMVGNLGSSFDSDRLKDLFGKSGCVKDAFVKENDRGKFAFVTMETVEQCEAVSAEFGGKTIDGSRLRISWAKPRTGGPTGTSGGSNCFKCQQPGHRAAACPGSSGTSITTSFSASATETSGWDAAPSTASTETTGSAGWTNSAPVSSEASSTTSGWADKPAEALASTGSGGGWGEPNPTSSTEASGGWGDTGGGSSSCGSSSTPAFNGGRNAGLTGDPCPDERHGGFKLNLMGIANSVDGERLKELFGKSGTVKDVFIKDGEKGRFGFITMESVEQCEAAAASLGGMTIDGSRLKVSWARGRPGNPGNSSGPKPAGATCFKCGQSGHRSFECPGSKGNTTPQVTSTDTSSSGWDSAPAASNENSSSGGWDNASAGGQGGWGDSGSTSAAASDGNAWGKTEETAVKEEACGLKEYLKLKKMEQLEEQERLVNEILESKAIVERLKKQKQMEALRIERAKNMAPRLPPPPRSLPKSRMYPDMFTPEEREIAARQYGIAKIQTQKEREHFLFSGERSKADILADAEESMNGLVQLRRRSDSPDDENENFVTPVASRKRSHTNRSDPVSRRVIQSTNSRSSRTHEESPEFVEPTSKSDNEDEEYTPKTASAGKRRKSVHFNQTVEVFQEATGLFAPDEAVSTSTRGNKRAAADSSTPKESGSKRKSVAVVAASGSAAKDSVTVKTEQVATPGASSARYETRSRKKKSVFDVDPNSPTPILDMIGRAAERRNELMDK